MWKTGIRKPPKNNVAAIMSTGDGDTIISTNANPPIHFHTSINMLCIVQNEMRQKCGTLLPPASTLVSRSRRRSQLPRHQLHINLDQLVPPVSSTRRTAGNTCCGSRRIHDGCHASIESTGGRQDDRHCHHQHRRFHSHSVISVPTNRSSSACFHPDAANYEKFIQLRHATHLFNPRPRWMTATSSNNDVNIFDEMDGGNKDIATASVISTKTTTLDSMWKHKTDRLLNDVPIGSMSANEWGEAHTCILHWLDEANDNDGGGDYSKTSDKGYGLVASIDLFDRLFKEERQTIDNNNKDGSIDIGMKESTNTYQYTSITPPGFFNVELLNLILNSWRQQAVTGRVDHDSFIQPQTILTKVYMYQDQSRHIRPNTQTFGMIMDGIASIVAENGNASSSDMTTKERKTFLMEMVDGIIDRLVDGAIRYEEQLDALQHINDLVDSDDGGGLTNQQQSIGVLQSSPAKPNVFVFSAAMNAWVKSGLKQDAAEQVEKLLVQMKDLAERFPDGWRRGTNKTISAPERIAPNRFSYSTAIDSWAKVGNVHKVKALLHEMYETDDEEVQPGIHAFNGLLVALAENGMSDEAEAVLNKVENLYESGSIEDPPNEFTYSTVLDSYCQSKKPGAAHSADALFRRMTDVAGIEPSVVSYNSLLNAHVKAGNMRAAEAVLEEMHVEAARRGSDDLAPSLHTYSTILSGIAKSGNNDAGKQAVRVLDHIEHLAETGEISTKLDNTLYNTVLDAIARSSYDDSVDHAKQILERMRKSGIPRDVITYNTILRCLSSRDAEQMLDIMEKDSVAKNATTYNTLLVSYLSTSSLTKSKSRSKKDKRREQKKSIVKATRKAERLFSRMQNDATFDLDVVSCNTMLHFYALGGDAKKAQKMLDDIQNGLFPSVKPDATTFNTVINAYANSSFEENDGPEKAESLLQQMVSSDDPAPPPNTATFNSVISAWVKSQRPEAAQRCENLFKLMKDVSFGCEPDAVTYNMLIHSFSSSASFDDTMADRAESVLAEMEYRADNSDRRLRPNNQTYGSMISVWSRCHNRPESGEMAEKYLRRIVINSTQRHEKLKPRVYEFVSTIRAWKNSGDKRAPFKADEIFSLLLHEYETKRNKEARPTSRLFELILSTIADSKYVPTKAVYANKVLELMQKYSIPPNDGLVAELGRCYRSSDNTSSN